MYSMTGMGRARGHVLNTQVRVEIKAVNHRFCDVHFRAPVKYSAFEIQVQQLVKSMIARGRVDIFITEEKTIDLSSVEADALKSYYSYLTNIKELLDVKEEIGLSHIISGISTWINKEIDIKAAWNDFKPLLQEAMGEFDTNEKG